MQIASPRPTSATVRPPFRYGRQCQRCFEGRRPWRPRSSPMLSRATASYEALRGVDVLSVEDGRSRDVLSLWSGQSGDKCLLVFLTHWADLGSWEYAQSLNHVLKDIASWGVFLEIRLPPFQLLSFRHRCTLHRPRRCDSRERVLQVYEAPCRYALCRYLRCLLRCPRICKGFRTGSRNQSLS